MAALGIGIGIDLAILKEASSWNRPLTAAARQREAEAGLRQSARNGRPPVPYRRGAKRRPPSDWLEG